ncbi:signal peptidase I [Clostridium sediminicola]|uniref:signal peptidase I n=1 Tax=Clostridium sediminicola TaxID=3114879 RepID=UPI0031F2715C
MKLDSFVKDWIIPVVLAVALAFFINAFIFFQVSVPTSSMYPTIKPGDRIIVTRVYNPSNLDRGDIVVFESDELKETLIKRLIGLPGDEIQIDDSGTVFVNGEIIDEPYIVNPQNKPGYFAVPEGKYLFLGDNRANSKDSRYWENPFIDANKIKGKARFILFPFKRFGEFKIGEEAVNH